MKVLKKLSVLILAWSMLIGIASAKECVNVDSLNIGWTSYKTLQKIGVSGNFKHVTTDGATNSTSVKDMLQHVKVVLNLKDLDAGADVKNSNIAQYFVSNLASKNVNAKIVKLGDKVLDLEITLNGITKVIPMKYEDANGKVKASGVLDAFDFGMGKALKVLNTSVAGHKNKGWFDIPVSFDLAYNKKCI